MRKHLVYDLPTRFFHWLIAGLFLVAFVVAKTIDDESPTFVLHMFAGLTLTFVVVLRFIWGIVGSRHARFASFPLSPASLIGYFRGVIANAGHNWPGHNPASAWVALFMLSLTLGLGFTGCQMVTGGYKTFGEAHEIMANSFLVLTLLHIAGVVLHTVLKKDPIGLSMFDGKKKVASAEDAIKGSRPVFALILVALVGWWVYTLTQNYDAEAQVLNLFGNELRLGERGHAEGD